MPDLDGGHYFFTALVPIRNIGVVEHAVYVGSKHKMKSSPIHVLRETLETLPTALQSHATEEIGIQSPFARNLRTHFARLAILDQPNYNGRDPENALLETIRNTPLLTPQPQDEVTCPYLIVMIDFDPATPDAKGEPRRYFEDLWGVMPVELTAIFRYCYGWPEAPDAASFADFILPCPIESVMTFNDYYTGAPPLKSLSKWAVRGPPDAGRLRARGHDRAAADAARQPHRHAPSRKMPEPVRTRCLELRRHPTAAFVDRLYREGFSQAKGLLATA